MRPESSSLITGGLSEAAAEDASVRERTRDTSEDLRNHRDMAASLVTRAPE
jgi:hypothetical protein